ncbi:MAG: tRNA (adenosine(37)-N6)-dimethylallyltransferase MiaA [Bacteroidota bacterium]
MKKYYSKFLVVVVGPTAVGKTGLCLRIAQNLGCEIISSDARQVYQKMNIGTAKPTLEEQQAVRHHMIDVVPLERSYHASAFAEDSLRIMEDLWKKSSTVIMTGGSGLYIQSVCKGLSDMPDIDPSLRNLLISQLKREGLAPLLEKLKSEDPLYYQEVDRNNPRRVLHALEVSLSGQYPYSYYRKQSLPKRPFNIIKIGLYREREVLKKRIATRIEQMLEEGLVEEVRSLMPYQSYASLATIGYQELFSFLQGEITLEKAIQNITTHTNQYAKRQMTWFRRDPAIQWFHPDEEEKIINYLTKRLEAFYS